MKKLFNVKINTALMNFIEKENIVPLRLSTQKKDKHVNWLYIEDNNVRHFACIKNLSRLVSSQLNKHNGQKYICDRCLRYFESEDKLQSHTLDYQEMNDCAIRLPGEKNKLFTFNNFKSGFLSSYTPT
ncbi:hypothetical protein ACFW04_013775 [Cataglyphis niger]